MLDSLGVSSDSFLPYYSPNHSFLASGKNLTTTTTYDTITTMTTKDKKRITLFLDPDRISQAKIQAVAEEISLSELVEKALDRYPWYQVVVGEVLKLRELEKKKK